MELENQPIAGDIAALRQRFLYCASEGLLMHAIPANRGGNGNRFADLVNAHQTLGKACKDTGLLLSINAHLWGSVFPILNYGNSRQQEIYLQPINERPADWWSRHYRNSGGFRS